MRISRVTFHDAIMRLNLGTATLPAFDRSHRPRYLTHCRNALVIRSGRGRFYHWPWGGEVKPVNRGGIPYNCRLKFEYIYIYTFHPTRRPQRPTNHQIHNGSNWHFSRLPRPFPPALEARRRNLQFPRSRRLPHRWQHWERKAPSPFSPSSCD